MQDLVKAVSAIILVALVAGAGLIVLDEFQNEQETTITANDTMNCTRWNSTYSLPTVTNDTFYISEDNTTLTSVTNSSNNVAISSATTNYSFSGTDFQCINDNAGSEATNSSMPPNGTVWVVYTYIQGSDARNVYGDGITGVGEVTSWLDIIALIVAASLLVYLIFKGMNQSQGGRY